MKKINIKKFVITILAILFAISTASAADRVKVFEIAESGHTFEFPMTPEEIAAEDAGNSILKATGRMNVTQPNKRVKVFEMGEGGHRVVFPMTAAEITAANAENARLAAIRSAGFLKSKKPVVEFELAESGHFIEFPVTIPDKKMDLGDLVIARENPQQIAVRAQ